MGEENPIHTLGDYSKHSHEGYRNTIELPARNNVVPLLSDTIQLVQNRCSFHELWSEDPNQHLKDFLKLVDSLDLDGENRERTCLEEERSNMTKVTHDNTEKPTETEAEMLVKEAETKNRAENVAKNKSIKTPENEEIEEAPGSQPIAYYLKHKINEKLIKGLVNNNRFNNSRLGTRVGKKKGKEYKVLHGGPVYDAILKKKITKKEDIKGNFEIPCSIGDLKHLNALVDQGSDVNVMPYSMYTKLTYERPAETYIKLSLASYSYIYPLGIAEDVLVEVAEHVYPFDKGTITLRSGKSKVSFHRIPDSSWATDKGVKNDIEPTAPAMTVNRLVLEYEEKIKLHLEREMKFNQWRSKNFKGKHPTLVATKEGMDDEGEVTLYLMRRNLEVLRKFHWMILGGRFNRLSHVSSPLLSKPGEY
ncbi:MAK10-like protein [Tanacetum coccineum]